MKGIGPIIRNAVIGAIIVIVIVLLHVLHVLSPLEHLIKTGINHISTPIYDNKVGASNWVTDQICKVDPNNTAQQDRIDALTQENAHLSQELREFDQVRDITGYTTRHEQKNVFAHVVGKVSDPGTQALILDKGLRDGIHEGYAVIAGHGILIGKTASVTDSTSQLILLNDRRSTVAASLIDSAQTTGLVQGEFGLGLRMNMIPSNEPIHPQAVAVTSGFETGIPGGLVIGTIDQVHHDDAALFQDATVSPPLRYDQLNVVSVLLTTN